MLSELACEGRLANTSGWNVVGGVSEMRRMTDRLERRH